MLINDMMVHHFDLMRYVLGQDPESVHAITWNPEWGWHAGDASHAIVFRFPSGLVATHVSVGCAVGSQTTWNGSWRIEGPEGSLEWELDRMWYTHLHRTPEKVRREIFPEKVPAQDQAMLDEFFAAIREDREPECSARDNLQSLAMVFAAIQSAKEGRSVRLSELG
jgi:predicted dehydrogenase